MTVAASYLEYSSGDICASMDRCFFSLCAIGLKVARVSPPEIAPPSTGTALDTPLANVDLTIFWPNIAAIFFTMG